MDICLKKTWMKVLTITWMNDVFNDIQLLPLRMKPEKDTAQVPFPAK